MATRKPRAEALEADKGVEHVTPADGNVFLDIGLPRAEAERLLVHADLSITIESIIRSRRLTRSRAAALFGVTPGRVTDLLRGRHELFTIDALVEMLATAGYRVRVAVEDAGTRPAGTRPAGTRTGAPSRTRPSTAPRAGGRPARAR